MKCDTCIFFDCGSQCKCGCHDEASPTPKSYYSGGDESGAPARKRENQAMEGLSSLFG